MPLATPGTANVGNVISVAAHGAEVDVIGDNGWGRFRLDGTFDAGLSGGCPRLIPLGYNQPSVSVPGGGIATLLWGSWSNPTNE